MTASGTPLTRLRRALRSGAPGASLMLAAELPRVPLDEALALCVVLAEIEDERYPRAAARWQARLVQESDAEAGELALWSGALGLLVGPQHRAARGSLAALAEGRGFRTAAGVLRGGT